MSRYGASQFASLLKDCVLWATMQDSAGVSDGIDEFPILPSGVTVTNIGTFTKTDLGNNKSVLNFDGSTNYISLTDNDAWDFGAGDFTIGMWAKISTTGILYMLLDWGSDPSNEHLFQIRSNNTVRWNLTVANSYIWQVTSTATLSANTWYHLAFVRYGNTQTIYIDGVASGTPGAVSATIANYSTALTIGTRITPQYYLNGNLKDLMIWKGRALTQPEIKLLMNRTHPITGAGLMPANGEYWRLT